MINYESWQEIHKELWYAHNKPKTGQAETCRSWFDDLKQYEYEDVHTAMKFFKLTKLPTLSEFLAKLKEDDKPNGFTGRKESDIKHDELYAKEQAKDKALRKIRDTQPEYFEELRKGAMVRNPEVFEQSEKFFNMYGKSYKNNAMIESIEFGVIFSEFERVRG